MFLKIKNLGGHGPPTATLMFATSNKSFYLSFLPKK